MGDPGSSTGGFSENVTERVATFSKVRARVILTWSLIIFIFCVEAPLPASWAIYISMINVYSKLQQIKGNASPDDVQAAQSLSRLFNCSLQ